MRLNLLPMRAPAGNYASSDSVADASRRGRRYDNWFGLVLG
jgi:hypothetical protein